ncbi:MAG TPA: ABC transporter ATP-binding protein [Clostridia bacterium]|nr:ABC transporter ATP-binding protein [Clostridia bacterium]
MIRTLAKSIKEYKLSTIITPILVTLEVIMEALLPLVTAELIDKGISVGDMNSVYRIGIKLIVLSILALAFGATAGITAANASSGFAKNIRKDLYCKVQNFSFSNIDKFSTASLVTRLTTDVSNVQRAFQMIIRITVRCPLMIIISLALAMKVNRGLASIFLIIIPIVILGLGLILKNAYPIMARVFKKYDELNNVVEENINGIRVVKSLVREEKEKNKFEKISNEIYKEFSKGEKIIVLNSPVLQSAIYICIILISWFGAKIIINSNMTQLTTGQLMTMFTYSIQILFSLLMLSVVLVMLVISRTSIKRIAEVLQENPDIENDPNPINELINGDIEFKNVGFSYINKKDKEVLKNINLKIKSGETVGIIGSTGSSKSSLVNLIPRLYDVTEGEVIIGGINVKKYDIKTIRNEVACVLQKNVLFSGTIIENLKWGNESATDEEIINACKLAQADNFIQEFEKKYNTYIEQGGNNVSGGQKQRICIARALLKKPKILILDDSTSAIDTKTDKLIRNAFKEKIPNTTKIIIAQRVASIEDADKIVVMNNGTIDAVGKHEDLIKSNIIYKEVYDSQMKGSSISE